MLSHPSLDECRLIELPKIVDRRGNLTFVEGNRQVPFRIERIYFIYDVPAGESRAGHAHRALAQVLIATSGSFDVILDNARERRRFSLNRPYLGLYLPRMIWREIDNFSSGAVCLSLASLPYDEADYIRDYTEFVRIVREAP